MDKPPAPADPHGRDERAGAALSTGALARRLGVSPVTLRSWDRRYGLGPAERGDGRHRRWSARDIGMVEEMCRLTSSGVAPAEAARLAKAGQRGAAPRPASTPAAPGDPAPGDAVRRAGRGLARAAVRLDSPRVQGLLNEVVRKHGPAAAWETVMAPTLQAVGRRWESAGDRYMEIEHLLSWHISTALRSVPLLLPASGPPADAALGDAPPAVLACAPGEQHSLALEALHATLGEHAVPTLMLGAAVPAEALFTSIRRTGPAAVVLWAQTRSSASLPLAQHVAAAEWGVRGARRHPSVLLAGPGWGPPSRDVPGVLPSHSLQDALATVHRLSRGAAAQLGR